MHEGYNKNIQKEIKSCIKVLSFWEQVTLVQLLHITNVKLAKALNIIWIIAAF